MTGVAEIDILGDGKTIQVVTVEGHKFTVTVKAIREEYDCRPLAAPGGYNEQPRLPRPREKVDTSPPWRGISHEGAEVRGVGLDQL
jgi:hypothetical protein